MGVGPSVRVPRGSDPRPGVRVVGLEDGWKTPEDLVSSPGRLALLPVSLPSTLCDRHRPRVRQSSNEHPENRLWTLYLKSDYHLDLGLPNEP